MPKWRQEHSATDRHPLIGVANAAISEDQRITDALRVDAVVLRMRPDEPRPDDPRLVLHFDYQPVLAAAHVEHDTVVAADARAGVLVLDVLRTAPFRLEGLFVPAAQRASCIRATRALPEPLQAASGDDSH